MMSIGTVIGGILLAIIGFGFLLGRASKEPDDE